jgi:hypothetical protein
MSVSVPVPMINKHADVCLATFPTRDVATTIKEATLAKGRNIHPFHLAIADRRSRDKKNLSKNRSI